MSPTSKFEYLNQINKRYHNASKLEKGTILNEFCSNCGYNRKYAIRLLNQKSPPKNDWEKRKRGPKKIYDHPDILKVLTKIWVATNLPCSKRLKAIIPIWLPHYPCHVAEQVRKALLTISPATIDRLLAKSRFRYNKRGLATTKPGSIIKKRIPIKTKQWDETRPGFIVLNVAMGWSDIEPEFVLKNVEELTNEMEVINSKFPNVIKNYNFWIVTKIHKFRWLPEMEF